MAVARAGDAAGLVPTGEGRSAAPGSPGEDGAGGARAGSRLAGPDTDGAGVTVVLAHAVSSTSRMATNRQTDPSLRLRAPCHGTPVVLPGRQGPSRRGLGTPTARHMTST